MQSENRLKYERERCSLAMSTGIQPPSARLHLFTARLLYFKSNRYSFCDAYSGRRTGSRPEWALGSLLASPSGRCPEQTPNSDTQLVLIHSKHAKPSRSLISIAWKSVEGGAWILAQVVVMYLLCMSWHTVSSSIVLQPILTLRIPSLMSRSPVCHCGHLNCVIGIVACFKRPTCRFCHSL